jgi:hypothetical protein
METKNFSTLAELGAVVKPKMIENERLHKEDGLYSAEDVKVYVDMYRKSIIRHQGSDFASGRVSLEDIAVHASKHYGKTLKINKVDSYDIYPTVHIKEVN